MDSAGLPYSGGTLTFYISGTSTKLDTYNNPDLAAGHENANPMTLNAAGRTSTAVYLQNLKYKVVLADANAVIVWTADTYDPPEVAVDAQFHVNAGNPNGSVAGTAGSGTVQADAIWDITNNILYVCTTTGSSSTAVWTAVNATATNPAVPQPQGRLTLTSATPVLAADALAQTAVYYTPYVGNLVPIYNGSAMIPTTFAELTLTLNATPHVSNSIYDVFMFSNSGVATICTGPAWTTITAGSGARGAGAGTTQLSRVAGYWVNTVSMTGKNGATTYSSIAANQATYLGSIFIDGTAAQISCMVNYGQSRKWGVWNAYNRAPIIMLGGDATATWAYSTNTIRQSRADATNTMAIFSGLPEEVIPINFVQSVTLANGAGQPGARIGVGVNSTTVISGASPSVNITNNTAAQFVMTANHIVPPFIGINNINMLETGNGTATSTFNGTSANMMMTAAWRG